MLQLQEHKKITIDADAFELSSVSVVKNSDWEVLTPTGWSSFSGIKRVNAKEIVTLEFSDGSSLISAVTHKVKLQTGVFASACDVNVSDVLFGGKVVVSTSVETVDCDLYDMLDVELENEYYTNDVVSHNCAFIRNFEEIWSSAYPTLSAGGKAILISTPAGVGNYYHKMWQEAEAGTNNFNPIKLAWDMHPERDRDWFEKTLKSMSKKKFSREYLCDFESSGDTFLNTDTMDWLRANIRDPIEHYGSDRGLWVWKHPEHGRNYVLSADVSRGDSSDYSTFHVIDIVANEIVAEYMGKIPPDKFADYIREVASKYNRALVCPENNTFGYVTCMRLKEIGYRRLYYCSAKGMNAFEYAPSDPFEVPGFTTQVKSRVQALNKLEEMLRNQTLLSYSNRLYSQMQTFVWIDGKATASSSAHDDLVMSVAIGAWLLDVTCGTSKTAFDTSSTLIKYMSVSTKDVSVVNSSYANVCPPQLSQARLAAGMFGGSGQKNQQQSNESHVFSDLSWLL